MFRQAIALAIGGMLMTGAGAATPDSRGVSGSISVTHKTGGGDNAGVAIWLKPAIAAPLPKIRTRIAQKDKRFDPSILVVPVGSVIDFPNQDPFFHNVFSMFDGKRFDLGLYEAGTSRSVTFSMAGVCYVFCNIHPEMSAVVVVVDTPYYAVSDRTGAFFIPRVPPGRYQLFVWHDRYKPENDGDLPKELVVAAEGASAGVIRLVETSAIAPHKNKFGHDYAPPAATSPIYRAP